jgi:hypothetical protein
MQLTLLNDIPACWEEAAKLVARKRRYYSASLTYKADDKQKAPALFTHYPKFILVTYDRMPYINWLFTVIFCRNPYTEEVFGFMRRREPGVSGHATYGIVHLCKSKELVWSGEDYYQEYSHEGAAERAYREWVGMLTCP